MTVKLMGPGYVVSSDLWHQGAAQNSFSPLLGMGSEEGLCFGERDDSMVVSGEKGKNGAILLLSQCRQVIWMGLKCYRKGLSIL